MGYFEAVVLGLLQGLAEFLPISSSGHLALAQSLFGVEADKVLLFAVLLHLGTLIAVFVVYWKDIWELIVELCVTIKDLCTGKGLRLEERPVRKLGVMIIVATIPTAVIGLLFNDFFEGLYSSMVAVGIGFLITGVLMFLAEKMGSANRDIRKMNCRNALFIGVLQGIAIYPGISRSGSTLVGGLTTGLKREFAVKFAFLISIPSILGSVVLEAPKALEGDLDTALLGPILAGMLVAAVSGYFAIKTMIRIVSNKKLSYFSYYVWILGLCTIGYGLFFA
ncbi:undecaprenyl-diphosphate phosphatase [Anaerovoracaceae bacterium 41-7]|uniref:undecaprenyl-diphosphate phosphatase n=1 Tax=unclassified Emergencia TaxID=2642996 RepID=UPI00137B0424|nr:undecaprenyl-diphosphate phosphatase [Emergencia sp. 1XD21-10]MCI9475431.1 undecaprenyl-diphosphate phosphatase [Emergencia sp.]MCI9639542.1 undecaprenyl-diphosphate phosphatase [Emergencia sp.]NCE98888.1 undecaprenyl-diphosphate phosphatase [Emergencia sp. 1XD21-10]